MTKEEMLSQIKQFIEEYELRIEDCDKLLEILKSKRQQQRKGVNVNMTYDEIRADRMKEDAKRQAYIQFISNLKEIKGEM